MLRHFFLAVLVLHCMGLTLVSPAKQKLQLSDSYMPVAMQIIAHITDQLTYESSAEATKPTSKPTTSDPWATTRPTRKPTTPKPLDWTTPLHKPGLYAPEYPPKPEDWKQGKRQHVVLPIDTESSYGSIQDREDQVNSDRASSRSEDGDDYDEENLQYLNPNVRNLIKLANDPDDERIVDVWDGERSGPPLAANKVNTGSLSASHLRLLLLYDLLSREAKKQKLSDFNGFSEEVLRDLEDTSNGGAAAQLTFALNKMLERHDCQHEYANNRAREIISDLAKDDSKISMELRYLKPLVYSL